MLAATSWAARLKAGLARTREVLNTDLGTLISRRKIDESLFDELETALLTADCGVEATRDLIEDLRGRAKKDRLEDGAALKNALKAALLQRLAPLERNLDPGAHKPCVIVIAGVNGGGKTTSIGKLAKMAAGGRQQSHARGGGHVPRRGARATGHLGRAQRRAGDRPAGRGSGRGGVRRHRRR